MKKAVFLLCLILLFIVTLLSGCKEKPPENFQLYIGAPYLVEKKVPQVGDDIRQLLPALAADGAMECTYVKAGDLNNKQDAREGSYGLQQITKKLTAGQIDVLIATPEVARVQALNNLLLPLSDIFTVEELAMLEKQIVQYDYMDYMLNAELATGMSTPDCGLDIAEHEIISPLVSSDPLGIYVAANAPHPEQARSLIRLMVCFEP